MSEKYKVTKPMKSYAEKRDMYYVEGLDTVSDYEDWGYTLESATLIANALNGNERLQATNKELLSALEWIVSEIKDCAQPEDWESFDACEKAINNAKQVMGDSDDNS